MKYEVQFNGTVIVNDLTIEQACQFALSLHQSSNVTHTIGVVGDGDDNIISFSHSS